MPKSEKSFLGIAYPRPLATQSRMTQNMSSYIDIVICLFNYILHHLAVTSILAEKENVVTGLD
jgi:hypothetical protein